MLASLTSFLELKRRPMCLQMSIAGRVALKGVSFDQVIRQWSILTVEKKQQHTIQHKDKNTE
jgi:hypothetical protein